VPTYQPPAKKNRAMTSPVQVSGQSPGTTATTSANRASRLVVIAGHAHMDTYTHHPAQYMSALLAFIDQQLGQPQSPTMSRSDRVKRSRVWTPG
jgi:hypothetical protein